MTLLSSLAIIVLAALIHASFQLSVSVFTLMSSHAIGTRARHQKLLRLMGGFVFGAGIMVALLLSATAFVLGNLYSSHMPVVVWAVCCGGLIGVGVSVWRFYYREGKGTSLWIPRGIAKYLHDRSKATRQSAEAFGLGMSSIVSELLFVAAPIFVSALALIHLSPAWQLAGAILYTAISVLPLLIVGTLIGGGHKLSHIQRWRESNKHFLQFAAGGGLLVLGVYVYVDQVVSVTVHAVGGQ